MREILVLQHAEAETLGAIADALAAYQIESRYVRPFAGEPVPVELGRASGLILMGGPMGVYETDRFPFLLDEMRLIEAALKRSSPILGICLGSQLLAAALGAEVRKGERKEIGWYPVKLTSAASSDPLFRGIPQEFTAFHWHGDVFSLPSGADNLASSALTTHQAFRYDSAYGLLFHPEVTESLVRAMTSTFAEEAQQAGADVGIIRAAASQHLPALQKIGSTIFRRWSAKCSTSAAGRSSPPE